MKTFETIPLNSREVLVILSGDDGYQHFKVINKELPTRLLSRCEIRDVRGYSREFSGIAHIERALKIPDGIDSGLDIWLSLLSLLFD